jgi:histidinol-phosphate aminotransferase
MFSKKPLVPDHIQNLKPYIPGKTIEEVRKIYKPSRISKLASNENRMGCSPYVKEAILNSMKVIHDYPDPISLELREKIAHNNNVKPENVLIAAGSESIISILCRTFFMNDDHAITGNATFVGFFVQAAVKGIKLKKIPMTSDFGFDVKEILNAIDEKTRMVYVANPNNPTGTYIGKKDYQNLIDGIPEGTLLINDEAYYEYACERDDYPRALDYFSKNVVVLRTFSKVYGLAGLRIGYAIADESLITEMMKTKLTFEPSVIAQQAAVAAYDDREFLEKSIEVVRSGKKRLYSLFDEYDVNYTESLANSVMIILDNQKLAEEFNQQMLINGVILRRVDSFGMPDAIRITVGTREDIDHFESVFRDIMSKYPFRNTPVKNEI